MGGNKGWKNGDLTRNSEATSATVDAAATEREASSDADEDEELPLNHMGGPKESFDLTQKRANLL